MNTTAITIPPPEEFLALTRDMRDSTAESSRATLTKPHGIILAANEDKGAIKFINGLDGQILTVVSKIASVRSMLGRPITECQFAFRTGIVWGYYRDFELVQKAISKADLDVFVTDLTDELVDQAIAEINADGHLRSMGSELIAVWITACYIGEYLRTISNIPEGV